LKWGRVDSRIRQALRKGNEGPSYWNAPQCKGGGAPLCWLFSLLVGPQVPLRPPPIDSAMFLPLIRRMLAMPSAFTLVSIS